MTIKRIEAQLVRLNARIEARQAELSALKDQRRELKERLAEEKKALKAAGPSRARAEPEGLTERIGAALAENVIDPLTEILTPPPVKVRT